MSLPLEPLGLPMIWGRIAIGICAIIHVLFASFLVGTTLIGVGISTVAYKTGLKQYARLSRMIAFILVLCTGTIAFMGVLLVFSLNIFWPRFWHTLFRIMFWPFLLEAGFFLGEAIFSYAWYYGWSWSGAVGLRRKLHLSFVWLAGGCSWAAMAMIDITASYMLTPGPPESFWPRIFNPTYIPLDVHRFFGNLVWAGFALAGISAIGSLRAKGEEDRSHHQWAGRLFFAVGFGALCAMPFLGFLYLRQIRYAQPQAFFTLMMGSRSWLFDLVALLYGLLVVIGSFYIDKTVRASETLPSTFAGFMPVSLWAVILAAIVFALPYRLEHVPFIHRITPAQINPLGKMQPNKYLSASTLVVFALAGWIYFLAAFRGMGTREEKAVPIRPDRRAPKLLIGLAVLSVLIYLAMGYSRETARAANGYLIYDRVTLAQEGPTYHAR